MGSFPGAYIDSMFSYDICKGRIFYQFLVDQQSGSLKIKRRCKKNKTTRVGVADYAALELLPLNFLIRQNRKKNSEFTTFDNAKVVNFVFVC